ncbi:Lrp/AsnC family transcriptional regulator [Streptomyces sp. NPDC050529]|uniref:Lrp/AsnC family transcriptional regulator n=1 Tax=unclassified Streptomyces TaxID=2593676 RepID=UPI002DD7D897|nr:AsnC family transcriptional regulator [Streptomyces sp. NBC_01022]WRZ80247.1 AsnC family transcriptional regulator [Streptomyces sp. NBC_01022]
MVDDVDMRILRTLHHAPRAPFRLIGEVSGVSEQTAARRYQALRRAGAMRVVGLIDPAVHGEAQWVARIRCRPDRAGPLADGLARRPDITYVGIASGGSEIICVIRSPLHAPREDMLLQQLPRSAAVLDLSIDLLIHPFGDPGTSGWTSYGGQLTAEQEQRLAGSPPPAPAGPLLPLTAEDRPLLDALAEDGRISHTQLAEVTGWSKGRVARRLESLEASGTLSYDIDLLPEHLGYHLNATLWLRVTPARLESTGHAIAAHDEVAFAAATSGDHNVMAIVICRDAEEFYRYLTTRLATTPGVDAYGVSIRVRRLKQAASLISHGRLVPPAPVQ